MLGNLKLKTQNSKPLAFSFLILFLLAGCGQQTETIVVNDESIIFNNESVDVVKTDVGDDTNEEGNDNGLEELIVEVPAKLELDVEFVSQAPFGNWDELHKEACEEAVIIMAVKYFNDDELTETVMENEIQKLVAWENENNYKIDLTSKEVVDILNNEFNLFAKLETEVTIDRIKYELNQGNLIIVPTAGRELKNPYFQTPGPIYHMLVIKGYDNDEFITNDVGTKRGDGFKYKYGQLINAIHDWNHDLADDGMSDEEMNSGKTVMIIVGKK